MRLAQRLGVRVDLIAILFLATLPGILFWSTTIGQGVFGGDDVLDFFYPTRLDYANSLAEGRLPLWTPGMGAGFPLFAEGQIGGLYPPNLLLYRLLPITLALSYSVLFHLSWASIGMFLLCRSAGSSTAGATLAGWTFALGGFFLARVQHFSLVETAAWLPWIVFLQHYYHRGHAERTTKRMQFVLVSVALGLQLLSGFPQFALLNLTVFSFISVFDFLSDDEPRIDMRALARRLLQTGSWVALGLSLAAVQLLPTAELATLSTRMAENERFFSSYALTPSQLAQFLLPFAALGKPSRLNLEYWGFIGVIPLILALLAPVLRPHRRTLALVFLCLAALSLTFGSINPLYNLLFNVPFVNRFRAPARFLYVFSFGAALLAAISLDELRSRLGFPNSSIRHALRIGSLFGLLSAGLLVLVNHAPGIWLGTYVALPWLFLCAVVIVISAGLRRLIPQAVLTSLLLGFSILELTLNVFPFLFTLDVSIPPNELTRVPVVFSATDSHDPYARIYSTASYLGVRPNDLLAYGKQSPQVYSPLSLRMNDDYYARMSPSMLNLLNVRYVIHPNYKSLSIADASPVFAHDYVQDTFDVPPSQTSQVEIVSYTKTTAAIRDGMLVGSVTLSFTNGESTVLPIRLGIETAEYLYDTLNAPSAVKHKRPSAALPFLFGLQGQDTAQQGAKFVAHYELASRTPLYVSRVQAQSFLWSDELAIDRISLIDQTGRSSSVASLAHLNDFTVAYYDNMMTMLENHDVMPRAFIVHAAQVVPDEQILDRLQDPTFQPDRLVLLSDGAPMDESPAPNQNGSVEITTYRPEQVVLEVQTAQPGYLVLADTWYPGWKATVDGLDVPIFRADYIFRAITLTPGVHTVAFEYRPISFALGAVVSTLAALICFAVVILPFRF